MDVKRECATILFVDCEQTFAISLSLNEFCFRVMRGKRTIICRTKTKTTKVLYRRQNLLCYVASTMRHDGAHCMVSDYLTSLGKILE